MDTTKKLLKNLPEHLLYFGAADLICLLLSFAVNMMLRPLLLEMARGNEATTLAVETALWSIFAALFYITIAVILAKSSIQRSAYLAATIGRKYSFFGDLANFCKGGLWTGVAAYAIFCLPLTVLLAIIPELDYIPTLFYPQYAMIELLGAWPAYFADILLYALFSLFLFPCLHLKWERERLYK